ncbi:unnamed protein product, partial [marine sediment metagenome]
IKNLDDVIVVARTSKTLAFCFVKMQIFSDSIVVFASNEIDLFAFLQSSLHEAWAWKYCTTMKTDLVYTPTNTFETFVIPNVNEAQRNNLINIGRQYLSSRKKILQGTRSGLTKTYNYFHSEDIDLKNCELNDFRHSYLLNLHRQLEKSQSVLSVEDATSEISKLRDLHLEMDNAVLEAYGWQDIDLKHDFYEVDYLPENARIRFTIHPDARKEVLKRLLELNHKIHEEEVTAGLWDKGSKKVKVKRQKKEANKVEDPVSLYGQTKLFEEPNLFSQQDKTIA